MPRWFFKALTRSRGRRPTPAPRKTRAKRFVCKPHLDSLECRWLPAVSVTGQAVALTEGVDTPATVATFTSDEPQPQSASDYSAFIDWGDGQTSFGTVQPNSAGGFDVLGGHAYADAGNDTIAVQITDLVDSTTASAGATATVADASLTPVGALLTATVGQPLSAVVASFTDGNPAGSAADFSATIDWGDGNGPMPATVQANDSGGYDVLGSTTFTAAGNYTVLAQITDVDGASAGVADSATVSLDPTDTAVEASTDQSVYGQDVTYTVSVTSSDNPVTDGTVSVLEDGTPLADPVPVDGNGQATFDLASLPVTDTPHNLDFAYNGTSQFDVSSATASLTVTPAPLTITVEDFTKTAGDPAPAFAVDYSGFVLSDDPSVLTGSLNFDPADTNTAGLYAVTASGLSSPNYDVTYVPGTLDVVPGPAVALAVIDLPAAGRAGDSLPLTVTAVDAYGNTATDYQGTVTFSSSDPQAQLPADYTFTGDDQGSHTFAVTLTTAGDQTVTAADTQDATLTQTSDPITVAPADAAAFQISAPASATVGMPFDVTVTVTDAYGNTVPDYAGTVHWSATNPGDLLPADYTFTGDDQGSHTFAGQFRLHVAGDDTLTATDLNSGVLSAGVVVSGNEPSPEVAAIGADGQVYLYNPATFGNTTPSYRLAVTGQVRAVDMGHDASGRAEVFALGMDNQVWGLQLDDRGIPQRGYFLTAPGQVKSFVVGQDGHGDPELFAIGLDDQVWAQKFDASGNPAGAYFLTRPGQVKQLSVGQDRSGNSELFVIGLDNEVWAQKFDAAGDSVSPYFLTQPGQVKQITVGQDGYGDPELFAIGLDNQVWAQKFDAAGDTAGAYFLTQPGQVKQIAVAQDGAGNPEVFAIGLDDQVWAQLFDAAGNSTGGYALTQPGRVRQLRVTPDAAGNPELFVIGFDDQVWAQRLDAAGHAASGYFLTAPGQVTQL